MSNRIPQIGDEFIPSIFWADEDPHDWYNVLFLDGTPARLNIAEVGHSYTKDGTENGEPDGGYEIVASDGETYDAYWHELGQCWVYGIEQE